jgi:antitoxin FitA
LEPPPTSRLSRSMLGFCERKARSGSGTCYGLDWSRQHSIWRHFEAFRGVLRVRESRSPSQMRSEWQPYGNHLCGDQSDARVFTERVWRSTGWARSSCGGLDPKTVRHLKEHARLNGRSLQQEVKALLERAAETLTMREARRLSERWRHRLGGRSISDSTQLIREDRESR